MAVLVLLPAYDGRAVWDDAALLGVFDPPIAMETRGDVDRASISRSRRRWSCCKLGDL